MPQRTLFDGWNIDQMDISVRLNVNKPGGRISVRFVDENGKHAGGRTVQWNKDRDLSDLGIVLRDVANGFMWAPQVEMVEVVRQSFERNCPRVPAAG